MPTLGGREYCRGYSPLVRKMAWGSSRVMARPTLCARGAPWPGRGDLGLCAVPPLSSLRFDGRLLAFICRSGRLHVTSTSHTQGPAAMYLTRSEYDRGVNTFSPEGRLFQVEYAIEAIKLGSTAVGLQTKSGCVLAVEKRLTSTLLDPASVEKIAEIDTHIGAAMSGLVADARTLVDHARVEAQNHTFTYDEPIGVEALTQGEYRVDEE